MVPTHQALKQWKPASRDAVGLFRHFDDSVDGDKENDNGDSDSCPLLSWLNTTARQVSSLKISQK